MKPKIKYLNLGSVFLKLFTYFIFFLVYGLPLNGQSQKTWQWVKQLGSNSWDISAGIVCDSKNNLYVTGGFFNILNAGSKKLKSLGNQDIFIAKFSENGELKELKNIGGLGNDLPTCLGVTHDDNIVFGGYITDTVSFNRMKISGKGQRLFIANMDQKGAFNWVNTISIIGEASLFLIGSDNQGRICGSGVFTGSLQFGDQNIISHGKKDIFLIRFNKSGLLENLVSFGSDEDESPTSMTINKLGDIIIAGTFSKTFEALGVKFSFQKDKKSNSFIVVLDNELKAKWINIIYGNDYSKTSSIKSDNSNNIYATGSFSSKLDVGDTTLFSSGYTDIFLLKYATNGNLLWAKSIGSWYYDYGNHINIDNLEYPVVTGSIGDTIKIDSVVVKPVSGNNSAMVLQVSDVGKALWGDCISGSGANFSNGSVIDNNGSLYFTGSFRNSFDKKKETLKSFGDQDIFVAKFFNCNDNRKVILGNPTFCPGESTELSVKTGFKNIIWNDTISGIRKILGNRQGPFWVNLIDEQGCRIYDTIILKQNPLPFFSLGNDTSMLVTDSLLLKAPSNYILYNWNDNSTGSDYLAKSTNGKTGTSIYWLSLYDSLLCTYTDSISITFLKGGNLENLENINLALYPNPATDRIYWYLNNEETKQFLVEITDGNGRVLFHQPYKDYISGQVKEINIRNLSKGAYNFRIIDPVNWKNFKTVKIIKQ